MVDHVIGGEDFLGSDLKKLVAFLPVPWLRSEFGGGGVEGDEDVLAELVAGGFDGVGDDFEGFFVGLEVGGEAAFIADGGVVALLLQDFLEGVIDFGAHAEGVGEAGRRPRVGS